MFVFLRLDTSTHVYFAQNVAYFPFDSWLSFRRPCRLLWGLLLRDVNEASRLSSVVGISAPISRRRRDLRVARDRTRRDATRLDSRATTNCAETRPPSPITSVSRATQQRAGGDVRSAADCDQSGTTAAAAAAAASQSTRACSDNGSSTNSPRRCNTFTDRVSRQGNAIGRVRPAVRFSYFIQRVL